MRKGVATVPIMMSLKISSEALYKLVFYTITASVGPMCWSGNEQQKKKKKTFVNSSTVVAYAKDIHALNYT